LAALVLAALLALLAALTGLLAWLLLPAALLLTRLWIVLLLLVTIWVLVLLRHFLLLGGFSARPWSMQGGRRPFRTEQGIVR
jgi:hypothetical protein